ncbi:hypothetical protein BH11PLA2_BH11PLA2_34400 [soil metagenome]
MAPKEWSSDETPNGDERLLLIRSIDLKRSPRGLLFRLEKLSGDSGTCAASLTWLAQDLGCAERSITNWLNSLRDGGFVETEGDWMNTFYIHWGRIRDRVRELAASDSGAGRVYVPPPGKNFRNLPAKIAGSHGKNCREIRQKLPGV